MTKQLWSDEKIGNLTFKNAANIDPDARWMHEQIAKDMRNDYERALKLRDEQLQAAQKIVTAAVAWYGLRGAIITGSPEVENYYQKCHDLEMAVLEFGAMQP